MNTTIEERPDTLAIFREQVRNEVRPSMSEAAAQKLRVMGEAERSTKSANKKFVQDFSSLPFLNPAIVSTILRRIGMYEDIDRMALKTLACLQRGWVISEPHDLVFFGELTDEEACMTEEQFFRHLESTPKAERKAAQEPTANPCKSGKQCMRFEKRKPAPAQGKGQYCCPACAASDRARSKRVGSIATG